MATIKIGDVELTRVVERAGEFGVLGTVVPESTPSQHALLGPEFHNPSTGGFIAAVQTWVLRVAGRTIIVDTGVGNDRVRTARPVFNGWQTDFLARLTDAGVRLDEVDTVINTHLHGDHVGWNTRLVDGEWVPTFPNATYLLPRADDVWAKDADLYGDSIEPIHRAGLAKLWEDSHVVGDGLVLEVAGGHTPGSSVLRLNSRGERAVFVGDLVHSPLQVTNPLYNSGFCLDQEPARESRLRVLGRAADEGELVVPAHFAGRSALHIRRDGTHFEPDTWADFS